MPTTTTEIVLRTPCTYHAHCDETAVHIMHGRSAKDGDLTDEEWKKACCVCEGVLKKMKDSLKATGSWTCPVCNTVHTIDLVNRGPVTPVLSFWYKALRVTKS